MRSREILRRVTVKLPLPLFQESRGFWKQFVYAIWNHFFTFGYIFVCLSGISLRHNLYREEGASFYDRDQERGFRFKDSAFLVPSRVALDNIWFYGKNWAAAVGLVVLISSAFFYFLDNVSYDNQTLAADVLDGVSRLCLYILYSDGRRRKIMSFLSSINAEDQAIEAACVAALLGNN